MRMTVHCRYHSIHLRHNLAALRRRHPKSNGIDCARLPRKKKGKRPSEKKLCHESARPTPMTSLTFGGWNIQCWIQAW
jgi:hypothetical protein